MTRLGRLTLLLGTFATVFCLALVPMAWNVRDALVVWLGSLAVAVLVARGVDEASYRRAQRQPKPWKKRSYYS